MLTNRAISLNDAKKGEGKAQACANAWLQHLLLRGWKSVE
jgi:hypothetical protein